MPLSDRQLRTLNELEWLYDPNARRTGRTMFLAIAAIRMACRNPGVRIFLFDHHHMRRYEGVSNLLSVVGGLVERDPQLRPFVVFAAGGSNTLTLNLPRIIDDWQPPEGLLSSDHDYNALTAAASRLRDSVLPPMAVSQETAARQTAEREQYLEMTRSIPADPQPVSAPSSPPKVRKPANPKSVWKRLLKDKF